MSLVSNKNIIKVRSAYPTHADVKAIHLLDKAYGDKIWTEKLVQKILTQKQHISALVATKNNVVVGAIMYEMRKKKFAVIGFVCKDNNFKEIAAPLISQLIKELNNFKKDSVIIEVREYDLELQLFLRSQGFRCVKILKNWYRDYVSGQDSPVFENAYKFQYVVASTC